MIVFSETDGTRLSFGVIGVGGSRHCAWRSGMDSLSVRIIVEDGS